MNKKTQRDYGSCLVLVLLLALAGFLAWRWVKFNDWRADLPGGLTVAGVPVEGATQEEALERVIGAYNGPILLYYRDRQLSLAPRNIGFQIDVDATISSIETELSKNAGVLGFLRYLFGQYPDPVDIPVQATYSARALLDFLTNIARQYDQTAKPPVPQGSDGSYIPGKPGQSLDIDASVPLIESALLSTSHRKATLVVSEDAPPEPDFGLLGQIIENEVSTFPGIASIFAKDLQTGDEISINAAVAYAGMSIVKVAIMEEAYRFLDQPPDPDTTKILTETMTLSGNFTANLLLRMIGQGDAYQGVEVLNASMQRLGLKNTFMATPYDEEVTPRRIVTEANSRQDLNTEPDPYMQTTPEDMGILLEMIYQCSKGGGALTFIYPNQLTSQECQAMIEHMLANQLTGDDDSPVLIAAGLPDGTPIAHKHGWVDDTRADASLVFTPGGDFVLVVYLYQPTWVDWEQTNSIMSRISQLLYAFFNPPS